ncbi:MAG: HAD-IC family P-type ATPase [Chlorobi bacterium]|nr:HAD-IC family P-type ATPase [Chlorobiota bacterium]
MKCYHCGEDCPNDNIRIGDKLFCCNGCKTVYELLEQNNLCGYYDFEENPGVSKKLELKRNYDFLDDEQLQSELIDFTDGSVTKVTFSIPQMHCSSCIWILENLTKLNEGVVYSEVDFLKKICVVQYSNEKTSLKEVVELLDSLGYQPDLSLDGKKEEKSNQESKRLLYKIGVAGFAFGNVMLFSFPEYLSVTDIDYENIRYIFSYLNILFALPVFFYSASEYFISAYKGLKNKIFNIDVPVSLGIFVLFSRSMYEILSQTGPGYFDSMSALVFLLLVGRLFQNKTYDALNFERNYKSYFPIAVTILKEGKETTKPVGRLTVGDRIIVKNGELIPADAILIKGKGYIDYSFVTGEATPVQRENGEMIYAGGRQQGSAIEIEIIKEVSQSYLTQLWNNKAFDKNYESRLDTLVNAISKYFTFAILAIATGAAIYWHGNSALMFNAFTAVLIIACPCALALSTPFTLGNTLRIFGKNKFYLKNTNIIERLTKATDIIFDKTGTITESGSTVLHFDGAPLNDYEKSLVKTLVRSSAHPLSRLLENLYSGAAVYDMDSFEEIPGKGIHGTIDGRSVKIGSSLFVMKTDEENSINLNTKVYLSIDGQIKGFFNVSNVYRKHLKEIIDNLQSDYNLSLLSGDNDGEKKELGKYFPKTTTMLFKQSPQDKLNFIGGLQGDNKITLMIGDGLNDAGALKQSDVGISISDDANNFTPACDGILSSESFEKLSKFIRFSTTSKRIILISFIISFLYNIIGIGFAVQGTLSPVISAILMPVSSISVVVFTTLATNYFAWRKGLL